MPPRSVSRTEKELKEFFDECKTRYPIPDSPEPGFRLPKRIAVQYFRANVDKFVDLKSVTDAEIKEEYDRDTDYYEDKDKSLAAEEKAAEAAKKTGTEKKTDAEKKTPAKKTEPEKKTESGKKTDAGKKNDAGKKSETKGRRRPVRSNQDRPAIRQEASRSESQEGRRGEIARQGQDLVVQRLAVADCRRRRSGSSIPRTKKSPPMTGRTTRRRTTRRTTRRSRWTRRSRLSHAGVDSRRAGQAEGSEGARAAYPYAGAQPEHSAGPWRRVQGAPTG